MNIFESLRKDHEHQRYLFDQLVKTQGDSALRRQLFEDLAFELKEHAKYEERYFYKTLIDSDQAQDKARHSIAEHKQIDDKVEELEKMEYSSTAWLTKLKDLKDCVEHHLDEEEHEFFQVAGKVITESDKKTLAKEYRKKMNETLEEKIP